ncbi:hypothetical protein AJ79_04113 [Helicocarpus griseus UAMH5409]|uniref:Uncharacterized protein n=1 Tax=Helicocarpus griseus UAMH5409 TaxID=1447875 RepID=A0A2B7XVV0_9EURO|nr:hypothetical protein AJ79_04113 [Helicocarpus griseus UAMH5409]
MALPSQIPSVTMNDLQEFQARHFLQNANDPLYSMMPATGEEELVDDELGYYPGGAKRTLTDEQIEIFRHSEIQKLQREKRLKDMEDREKAEEQFAGDKADNSPVDMGQLEARSKQSPQNHEREKSRDDEEAGDNITDRTTTERGTQEQNKETEAPLEEYGREGTTSSRSQRPPSSASNPFGRRLVSYDD